MNKALMLFLLIFSQMSFSDTIETCFIPGQDCAGMVVRAINDARTTINVQAYHLTNKRIINALERANKRGVRIAILLDKVAKKEGYVFYGDGIKIDVDYKPRIAHNKVMIIDDEYVITGSFNFTESAQKNAENLLLIHSKEIATQYENNFIRREVESVGNKG